MTISVSPLAYGLSTLIGALTAVALCVGARWRPGPWTGVAAKTLAVILVGEQVSWQIQFLIHDDWNRFNSLPFDLCDFTCFVAAVACWTQLPLFVELTWFWALAGTLQAIITPDQYTPFPHLSFDNYVVEHLGIVVAALYLVIGLRIYPRPGAVKRVFAHQRRLRRPVRHPRRRDRRRLPLPAPSPAVVQPPQRARPLALVHRLIRRDRPGPLRAPRPALPVPSSE